jgi:hypothetical protein
VVEAHLAPATRAGIGRDEIVRQFLGQDKAFDVGEGVVLNEPKILENS